MKRLLKVTAFTGSLTFIKMLMGFFIIKVVTIYTGPAGLAMLGQIQSMVVSLNGITNATVGVGIVRYTAENKEEGFEFCSRWWRASLQWLLFVTAIIVPIGILLSPNIASWLFDDQKYKLIVMATIIVLPVSALGTLCTSVINGQQLYRRYVALGIVSVLISSSVMFVMIMFFNIQGALFAAALQSALIGVVMLIANFRQPWFKICYWWGPSDSDARKAIGGYMLMAITSALTVPISMIFVRNILIADVGWDETGHWQAVWKISEAYLSVITVALGTYYLPRLSSLNGVNSIIKEINNTAKVIIPIVIAMSVSVYFLRDIVISILYTDEFRSARDLFAFQLSGDVIKIVCWLYAYPMISRGAVRWYMFTEIFFSLSFVLLSYYFVKEYGVIGASIAYLFNYSVCLIYVIINARRFAK